ncbi:MAG: 4'-phosphopantetheinyl transferase superfamily protein [Nitrospirae bacterium]|nr:4'-phosphopantetheinyl transferase superfamily protein [Nitrospirota bacterium]
MSVNAHSFAATVTFPSLEGLVTVDHPALLGLDRQTVHVWGLSLDGSAVALKCCHAWLSEDERGRAARFIRQEDQTRYTFAHGGLRAVLARYTGLNPGALLFQAGPTGKPALLDHQGNTHAIHFNLSHSRGRMLIAVTQGQEVGVDLEEMRDKVKVIKLAERFYAPSEYQTIARQSGSGQVQQFYRYWVAKEAVLKGQGVGILSLRGCEILTPDDAVSSQASPSDGAGVQPGWTIRWLACGAGWQGAVARQGEDWNVNVQTA